MFDLDEFNQYRENNRLDVKKAKDICSYNWIIMISKCVKKVCL